MRPDLDHYFKHCPHFIKRLELLRGFSNTTEQNVAIFKFGRQFHLLDAHLPIISYYVKHGEYCPELVSSPIELVDYSRGLVLTSKSQLRDFQKFYKTPIEDGIHIAISGDVNVEAIKRFIEDNSSIIREALNKTSKHRIKRFTPIVSIDKYIRIADEYHFQEGKRKTYESIANDNEMSLSTASKWIERLAPIIPPK